jgi:Caspase domain
MANRALLVGIDIYPDPQNNLNSCVADTLAFKNVLQGTYGFDSADVQLLHNQDATLSNVQAGLDTLFSGVQPGDRVVYFESSHGYRYAEGDTMVEVLCLYDGFLKDTELSQRTQDLPPNVLTVVLDACHSGGMNKMFFPNGNVQVARAKVWHPSKEQAERDAQLYAQVKKFKFFGRTATGETAAVAKNFIFDPIGVPPQKDIKEGSVDLNGALFAACQADQTAAAGSPPTENLSAFTYAITKELSPSIALSDLNQRVGVRLTGLNMTQTPAAIAPPMHPELLAQTFVAMAPAGGDTTGASTPSSAGVQGTGGEFDPEAWLREQLAGLN